MNDNINIIELEKAGSLGKIISSRTAQNIIGYIGDNEGCTASQIKTALEIPASSVHYNLKALIQSNIVDDSQFTYSTKGKQVIHHSLTNKILIVVPKIQNISAQLKEFIPGLLGVGAIALIGFGYKIFNSSVGMSSTNALSKGMDRSAPILASIDTTEAAPLMADAIAKSTPTTASLPWYSNHEFLLGMLVATICFIGFYLLYKLIKKSFQKK